MRELVIERWFWEIKVYRSWGIRIFFLVLLLIYFVFFGKLFGCYFFYLLSKNNNICFVNFLGFFEKFGKVIYNEVENSMFLFK